MFKKFLNSNVKFLISITLSVALFLTLIPATLTSASTSSVPKHVLVGYWHNFENGSGTIKLRDVSDNWDVINLSFGEPTSVTSGDIQFKPFNATEEEFKSDVKYLQSKGKKVLLSIGGQKDFKNPTTPVIVNLISALKELKAKYGDNFMLTMAPETFFVQLGYTYYGGLNSYVDSRAGSYLPVIYALRDSLDWLQVQYYNSGAINDLNDKSQTMGSAEFYVSLADMLLTGFNVNKDPNYFFPALREDQVVIGVPTSSYAGNGWVSNSEVEKAITTLMNGGTVGSYTVKNAHPNLRGLMTWSINWDKYASYSWSNHFRKYFDSLAPQTNTLKAPTLSASSVQNGRFTLSAKVPAYNTATSYKILEDSKVISSGTLVAGQSKEASINYEVKNKADGTYKYKIELSDSASSVNSNEVTVTVKAPTPPALKAATISNSECKNGNYTISIEIPDNNLATSYKLFENNTEIASGNLSLNENTQIITKSITVNVPKYEVETPTWESYTTYKVGDIVTYAGKEYKCIQPHTSLNGWEPSNVPALWIAI
ncbi:MAG: glycosyl hydrolase family 18 protein [Clostridium sp.]|nr:glycosyl hydrolase family 18 protein [Clostridium sp.]